MHCVYRTAPLDDVLRVVDYCRSHSVQNNGLFEVYPGSGGDMFMVIVNSCSELDDTCRFRPLGAFYCNYSGSGVISIEEEDPHFDGMQSRKRHVTAIKQVVDILLKEGYPDTHIRFNELPALRFKQ